MSAMKIKSAAFIGGGNMAEAIIAGMRTDKETKDVAVTVCDVRTERMAELEEKYSTASAASVAEAFAGAELTVLAVKPQDLGGVLKQMQAAAAAGVKTVMSIAAGVPLGFVASFLPAGTGLVRAMPNLPCLSRRGASGFFAAAGTNDDAVDACRAILECTGKAVRFDEEAALDAVTALSGSGPAYVFYFINALVRAAEGLGLEKDQALKLALATISGSCALLEESGLDADELIRRVASKGGTTEAALKVLDSENCAQTLGRAVHAAQRRARELAQQYGKA